MTEKWVSSEFFEILVSLKRYDDSKSYANRNQ